MSSQGGADPLILSTKAARRLQLLFSHGGRPVPGAGPVSSAVTVAGQLCLAAGLLPVPVPLDWAAEGGRSPAWAQARDAQSEVALHVDTFRVLKVPAGGFVEVRSAARPGLPLRLARALPSPLAAPGTALLAPSLAHNLGLALHLAPLLHVGGANGAAGGASEHVLLAPYLGPSPGQGTGGTGEDQQQQGWQQRLAALPQPSADAALVPVAEAVTLKAVRMPSIALLPAGSKQSGDAAAAGTAAGGNGGAGAAAEEAGEGSSGSAAPAAPGQQGQHKGGEEAVAALQQFLQAQPRLVCPGDMLAVEQQRVQPVAQLLPNLLQPPVPGADAPLPAASGSSNGGQGVDARSSGDAKGASEGGSQQQGHHQQPAGFSTLPPQLHYFRVERVLPEGQGPLAVDPSLTRVQLEGSCSSELPAGLPAYLAGVGPRPTQQQGGELGPPPTANGQAPLQAATWRQLAELLASALHPQGSHLPLRLAVLLHGPPGSGRQAAVRAAADAVGCHVVSLSCHDARPAGTPEKKVLEGLRAAFEAAGGYRPAVLLLRHFEALGGGESAGGPGGSEAFAARAGTALAECIRSGFRPPAANPPTATSLAPGAAGGGQQPAAAQRPAESSTGAVCLFPAPLVLVACVPAPDAVPPPLRRCFTHELIAEAPDQPARQALLAGALGSAGGAELGAEVLEELARHTAGLLPREVRAVAADAAALAAGEALPAAALLGRAGAAGAGGRVAAAARVREAHLTQALEAVRQRTATDIGAPRIPSVKWEDVGGLEDVKRAILDTVELPLKHPELFSGGLRRRSGVLLYGPPGTGKTLLAKAVATECGINFLSVKGPELINMYVGESERQIREVFARARRARPCVVFFDELDSLAPARGKGSDSGGVMDRVVAQLLAEIDGVQGGAGGGSSDLFLIGATNRPDLLDTALLRPGRLDRLLYVGIAGDAASRLRVLEALTRKFVLAPSVDLAEIAEQCPARFTGADMYALCSDAWMTALRRCIAAGGGVGGASATGVVAAVGTAGSPGHSSGGISGGRRQEEEAVLVTQADFYAALGSLQPSLSEEEVAKYERIRDQYQAQQGAGR